MRRFGGVTVGAAAIAALAGCDLDFIVFEDSADTVAIVTSEHAADFAAELTLVVPPVGDPATVLVDGQHVPAVDGRMGQRTHTAEVHPDSLHPTVRLTIRHPSGGEGAADIPLVARRGPAEWSAGLLHLPLTLGGPVPEPNTFTWDVVFYDHTGRALLTVGSFETPLPARLPFDDGMIPEAAVEARIHSSLRFMITPAPWIVPVHVRSAVVFPIPSRGSPAGSP